MMEKIYRPVKLPPRAGDIKTLTPYGEKLLMILKQNRARSRGYDDNYSKGYEPSLTNQKLFDEVQQLGSNKKERYSKNKPSHEFNWMNPELLEDEIEDAPINLQHISLIDDDDSVLVQPLVKEPADESKPPGQNLTPTRATSSSYKRIRTKEASTNISNTSPLNKLERNEVGRETSTGSENLKRFAFFDKEIIGARNKKIRSCFDIPYSSKSTSSPLGLITEKNEATSSFKNIFSSPNKRTNISNNNNSNVPNLENFTVTSDKKKNVVDNKKKQKSIEDFFDDSSNVHNKTNNRNDSKAKLVENNMNIDESESNSIADIFESSQCYDQASHIGTNADCSKRVNCFITCPDDDYDDILSVFSNAPIVTRKQETRQRDDDSQISVIKDSQEDMFVGVDNLMSMVLDDASRSPKDNENSIDMFSDHENVFDNKGQLNLDDNIKDSQLGSCVMNEEQNIRKNKFKSNEEVNEARTNRIRNKLMMFRRNESEGNN